MDLFPNLNCAAPAADRQPYPPYERDLSPVETLSSSTSRSTSPASTCPSPTSSVSSGFSQQPMSVAELADQLGRQSFHSARGPTAPGSTSSRRSLHPTDRRRSDRGSSSYHDTVRARRQAYGRLQHDARRLGNIGSLVERLMLSEHKVHPAGSSQRDVRAQATSAAAGSAQPTDDYDIPLSPSAASGEAMDPFQIIDASVRSQLRVSGLTRTSRRRPNSVQKEVRMRKKPKFRPR